MTDVDLSTKKNKDKLAIDDSKKDVIEVNETEKDVIEVNETEKDVKQIKGCLVSRLDRPEYINYGNEKIVISPRQRINKILHSNLSFPLPNGINFIEDLGG